MSTVSWNLKGWAAPISRLVAWKDSNQTGSWPSGLLRLYRSTSGLKSLLGTISWTGTPTIDSNGVTPGAGPSFGSLARGNGKVFCAKVKMTKASTGITGDEHVLGPLYVRNGNLVAKVGGQEATHAHSWAAGDVVYAKVVSTPSGLTVGDI
jgi:hypothetical protein